LDAVDLMFLSVPGYFLLQAALTFWTSRGWRLATLVPAVIMVPILAYTVLAYAAQSNLWPLLLLFSAPPAFLYLVVLSLILLLWRLARAF
jgi:fumarate reductase subunit C